jgi:hypothetical protein
MQPIRSWLPIAASILAVALSTSTQVRASPFTFVSDTGSDANTCTGTSTPCRQLGGATGALAKTDEGGIVHVFPGDYAGFIIDKAIEIIADGGQASIANSAVVIPGSGGFGFAEIVVNADPDDEVRIRGFILDGAALIGVGGNIHGVAFIAGGALHLEDCTLVNGRDFGVVFAPTGASELYISNCAISGNGDASAGGGIQVRPTGQGSAEVAIDNVLVENNRDGVRIDGTATIGTNTATIRNSRISGSTTFGIYALDSGGGATNVTIEGSTSASNGTWGIASNGANVTERVRNSTISGNARGLIATNTSSLISHGGNVVAGNTVNGAFTQTVAQQ